MKKIIIFGNQQIGIDCVEILNRMKQQVSIVAVVGCETMEDQKIGYPSISEFCKKNKILYYNPQKLDDNFLNILRKHKPDICLSIFYRNIFSQACLRIPPMGFINFHTSLLPKYRGRTPTLWALLNNEEKVGITLHYIDGGIDTGDIIAQSEHRIPSDISGYDLNTLMMKKGVKLFKEHLPDILKGTNKITKQRHADASYYGQFSSGLRTINWYMPIVRIRCQIQALTKPYFGAKTKLQGEEMLIWRAQPMRLSKKNLSGPGKIVKVYNDKTFIVTGVDGHLHVTQYEFTSKIGNNLDKYIFAGNKFTLL